jgi:hypothetical protein
VLKYNNVWNNIRTRYDAWAKSPNPVDYSAVSMMNHLKKHMVEDFDMTEANAEDTLRNKFPSTYEYIDHEKNKKKKKIVGD